MICKMPNGAQLNKSFSIWLYTKHLEEEYYFVHYVTFQEITSNKNEVKVKTRSLSFWQTLRFFKGKKNYI